MQSHGSFVVAVVHHYSFADDAAGTVAEDVWQFCDIVSGLQSTSLTRRPADCLGLVLSWSRRIGAAARE
jgi:hypothetical protein